MTGLSAAGRRGQCAVSSSVSYANGVLLRNDVVSFRSGDDHSDGHTRRRCWAGSNFAPGGEEVVPLAEEQLTVGKRLVNRGTTRIRRFVVETPVEEAVTLRSERVSVERRPVASDTKATDADFTDRTIEVTETNEEAVVGKTARVKEEVVVNKAATDRVETVRDTVRREDVEITRDDQATERSGTTTPVPPSPHPGPDHFRNSAGADAAPSALVWRTYADKHSH
jgi:uncharacterized protein (TIGR02271 family)